MRSIRKIAAALLAVLMVMSILPAASLRAEAATGGCTVRRLGGADRFETANAIANEGWDKAGTVMLASASSYADALAGVPLAHIYGAPILLVSGNSVNTGVRNELKKLGTDRIIILGGEMAVSSKIEEQLKKEGYDMYRVCGDTRYSTATAIADWMKYLLGSVDTVFVASGMNYPDALSASSAAALLGAPILYSPPSGKLDASTQSFIKENNVKETYVLGGYAAIMEPVGSYIGTSHMCRFAGLTRYETSVLVNREFDSLFDDGVALATGQNFPDALAGGVLAARKRVPVLLTPGDRVNDATKKYIEEKQPSAMYVFGGESAVSDGVVYSYSDDIVSKDYCSVTFSANGDGVSGMPGAQKVLYGSCVTRPVDPSRDGYYFAGWYTDAACSSPFDFLTAVNSSSLTLYAKWVESEPVEEDKVFKLYGTVADKATGEPVSGVKVTCGDISVTTGSDGGYSIELKEGAYKAVFEKDGYEPAELSVDIDADRRADVKLTAIVSDTEGDAMAAHYALLLDIVQNFGKYMTDYDASLGSFNTDDCKFTTADIDGDGVRELIVDFTTGSMASMFMCVWKYDPQSGKDVVYGRLNEGSVFYRNGLVRSDLSHNHSQGNTIWPYYILEYDNGKGNYEIIGSGSCADVEWMEDSFPYSEDVDGDGVIYYFSIGDKDYDCTKLEYEALKNTYIPDENILPMQWNKLTAGTIRSYFADYEASHKDDDKVEEPVAEKNYKWVVEPSVQADNIDVVFCCRPLEYARDYEYSYDRKTDFNSMNTHVYDSLSIIERNGRMGMIDYSGDIVVDIRFYMIDAGFDREYCLGDSANDRYYTLDSDRNLVLVPDVFEILGESPDYRYYWSADKGLYRQDSDTFEECDSMVSPLMAAYYLPPGTFVKDEDGYYWPHYENMNRIGRILLKNGKPISDDPVIYDDAGSFADNIIPVKLNGKWGYVDPNGKTVIPFSYDAAWNTGTHGYYDDASAVRPYNASDGYVVVSKSGKYALFSTTGETVIDFGEFEMIRPVYEGKCWVRKNGLWGVIAL